MDALSTFGMFFGGLGLFFGGVGFLWWCTLYAKKMKKDLSK